MTTKPEHDNDAGDSFSAVLADITEYLEQRQDADQPAGSGSPTPNEEMKLLTRLRAVTDRGGGNFKAPDWNHVWTAYVQGARDARENPAAGEADFQRAADGHTKRIFEQVDPDNERRIRENDWNLTGATQA